MSRTTAFCFLLCSLLALVSAATGQAHGEAKAVTREPASAEVQRLLATWAESLRDVKSLRVRFGQTKHLKILLRPRQSKGTAVLRGRRLVMRVSDDKGQRETELLVNEDRVEIHYPRLKRLEIYPAGNTAGEPPFPMVGDDVERLPESNDLRVERDGDDELLVMKPVDASSRFAEVRFRFRDGKIAGVEQKDRRGNRVVLDITEFSVNAEVTDDELQLTVAPDVVRMRFGQKPDRAQGRK